MDYLEREVEPIDDIPKVQSRKKPKLSLGMQVNGEIQASLLSMWHAAFCADLLFFENSECLSSVKTIIFFVNFLPKRLF